MEITTSLRSIQIQVNLPFFSLHATFLKHYVKSARGLWRNVGCSCMMFRQPFSKSMVTQATIAVAPSPLETAILPSLSFDDEEYSLNREAFERFSIIFGQFTWDLFASAYNAQCLAFFTRETNALAKEWASLGNLWEHPPCCLIDSVVGKLEAEPRAFVTVLTPHWPKAPVTPGRPGIPMKPCPSSSKSSERSDPTIGRSIERFPD